MTGTRRDTAWALAAVTTVCFVVGGTCADILTPILDTLMMDFAWSSGRTSSLAMAFTAGSLITTPLVGYAVDRYGPRTAMLSGVCAVVSGLLLASGAQSWIAMVAFFALVGFGSTAATYLPAAVLVTADGGGGTVAFGMALVMGAISAGAFVFAPSIAWLTSMWGWRWTLATVALADAAMFPIIWSSKVPRYTVSLSRQPIQQKPNLRAALAELRSLRFAIASLAGVLFGFGMQGIYFHVVSLLVKAGYTIASAGLAFGVTWLLAGIGSFGIAAVAKRWGVRVTFAAACACSAIGIGCLLGVELGTTGRVYLGVFILLWGLTANTFPQLNPIIMKSWFAGPTFGTVLGVQFAASGVASCVAPLLIGMTYDTYASYKLASLLCATTIFASGLLILSGSFMREPLTSVADPTADHHGQPE